MRFRVGQCVITISPWFTGMLTLMLLIDTTGMMSPLLLALICHECGHLAVMMRFQCLPKSISFGLFEVNMVASNIVLQRYQKALLAGAGILVNGVLALFTSGKLQTANLYLGLFNGLPVFSMDGYQLLSLMIGNSARGKFFVHLISAVCILLLAGAGICLLVYVGNPLLLLFCLYMSFLQIRTQRHT